MAEIEHKRDRVLNMHSTPQMEQGIQDSGNSKEFLKKNMYEHVSTS